MKVVAPHGLVVAIVEHDGQKRQVCFSGDAKALSDGVVEQTAIPHEGHHRLLGPGQFGSQRQPKPLPQPTVGMKVAVGFLPSEVPQGLFLWHVHDCLIRSNVGPSHDYIGHSPCSGGPFAIYA